MYYNWWSIRTKLMLTARKVSDAPERVPGNRNGAYLSSTGKILPVPTFAVLRVRAGAAFNLRTHTHKIGTLVQSTAFHSH